MIYLRLQHLDMEHDQHQEGLRVLIQKHQETTKRHVTVEPVVEPTAEITVVKLRGEKVS